MTVSLNFNSREETYFGSLLAGTHKSCTADSGKRRIELDPNVCERRGACGCLDLYCNVDLDLRKNSYASKSVWIVVQKCIHSLDEVKH